MTHIIFASILFFSALSSASSTVSPSSVKIVFSETDRAALGKDKVELAISDTMPGPLRKEAIEAGSIPVSKTFTLHSKKADFSFANVITVTIPYDKALAHDLPPAVVKWNPETKAYGAVSVINVDRGNGTVTFVTGSLGSFVAIVVKSMLSN